MTNKIFDLKFWGTCVGVLIALIGSFLFGFIPFDEIVSAGILAIGFYTFGRIDNGQNSQG